MAVYIEMNCVEVIDVNFNPMARESTIWELPFHHTYLDIYYLLLGTVARSQLNASLCPLPYRLTA